MSGRIPQGDSSEDEEEMFLPEEADSSLAGNRLGSLFSHHEKLDGNSTLTYKAPKQPVAKVEKSSNRKGEDGDPKQVEVLYATVAHAFVLKDGQYVPHGKLGVAVIGNRAKKEFKLLLYLSNKQPVGQATISDTTKVNVSTNKYVHLVDDRSVLWSLAFDNDNMTVDFLKWFLAVKASLLGDHHKEILLLDIEEGEGNSVQEGDLVEIEYVEYLIEEGPKITEFNGNANTNQKPLRIKLGKGESPKGWIDGLVGMKKRGKRLFVIPPDLGYSGRDSNVSFPINSPLMVYVILKRVKFSKKHSDQIGSIENAVERKSSTESSRSASNYNSSETVSNSQQLTRNEISDEVSTEKSASESDVHKRADLVNRMAKLGQAVIGPVPSVLPRVHASDTQEKPVVPPRSAALQQALAEETEKKIVTTQSTVVITQSSLTTPALSRPANPIILPPTGQNIPQHLNIQDSNIFPMPFPTSSTSAAMPYPYPFPYFLQPPFLPPPPVPSTGAPLPLCGDAGTSAKQDILNEIQRCHLQLQDALTKTISNNLDGIVKKIITDTMGTKLTDHSGTVSNNTSASVSIADKIGEMVTKIDQLDVLMKNSPWNERESMLEKKLAELGEHIAKLENTLTNANKKTYPATNCSTGNGRMESLFEKMEQMRVTIDSIWTEIKTGNEWKEKHDKVKSQALSMKEAYETRIQELEEALEQQGASNAEKKIKKIMSGFYKNVIQRLPSSETVAVDMVQQIVMDAVKESTLEGLKEGTEQITEDKLVETEIDPTNAQQCDAETEDGPMGNEG